MTNVCLADLAVALSDRNEAKVREIQGQMIYETVKCPLSTKVNSQTIYCLQQKILLEIEFGVAP